MPLYFTGHAQAALEASLQLALEGVVSKRVDSPYRPGRRSADWVKVKHHQTAEVVIGGWQAGGGRHAGLAGSLLLGVPDGRGRLEYVGHVGTGFTERVRADLATRPARLAQEASPFAGHVPIEQARAARWVRPALVGEVRFAERTGDGLLRHPSWRGLRTDMSPANVPRIGRRRAG